MIKFCGVNNPIMRAEMKEAYAKYIDIYPQFKDRLIEVKLSSGMRSRAGYARYATDYIQINYRLFCKYPENLIQTFGHEIAHLFSYWLHGEEGRGHKHCWKKVMHKFGLEDRRCHKMKTKRARWRRFTAYCGCEDKTFSLTKTKYYSCEFYKCKKCNEPLSRQRRPCMVAA